MMINARVKFLDIKFQAVASVLNVLKFTLQSSLYFVDASPLDATVSIISECAYKNRLKHIHDCVMRDAIREERQSVDYSFFGLVNRKNVIRRGSIIFVLQYVLKQQNIPLLILVVENHAILIRFSLLSLSISFPKVFQASDCVI